MLSLKPSQLPSVLTDLLKAKLTCNISGPPGCGKSDCVRQFCKQNKLYMIDLRLSQLEPTDLLGFPIVKEGQMHFAPPSNIPLTSTTIPKGYVGFCLFLDEMNSCSRSTASAAYKLILDKKVGDYSLHPNTTIIAAGNRKSDKAIVNDLGSAMKSRMVNVELSVSSTDWLFWANQNNIDQRIVSFIKFRPGLLFKFDSQLHDSNFPTPRTWEFTSKYISNKANIGHTNLIVMAGCVGEGAATEFNSYLKVYSKLPSIADIIVDPEGVAIEDEPSHYFAYTTLISRSFGLHPDRLILFINRLPIEFQVITLREAIELDQSVSHLDCVTDWCTKNGKVLY